MESQDLKIGVFSLTIQFTEKAQLPPFKGSTLRGGFGTAFKKTVCAERGRSCDDCILRGKCIYSVVFESPVDKNNKLLKGMTFAPHPFIIEPPITEKEFFSPEDELEFKIILFGKYIDNLVYFVHSFMKLGRLGLGKGRADFKVLSVKDYISNRELFFSDTSTLSGDFASLQTADILNSNTPHNINNIIINFETPARIKYEGHYIDNLPFNVFWKNISRRVRTLSSLYCNDLMNIEWNQLLKLSENIQTKDSSLTWKDWRRYSHRQKSKMNFGGLVGTVTYSGPLDLFFPFIKLGQFLHIGKNTSFGLGKYNIVE